MPVPARVHGLEGGNPELVLFDLGPELGQVRPLVLELVPELLQVGPDLAGQVL